MVSTGLLSLLIQWYYLAQAHGRHDTVSAGMLWEVANMSSTRPKKLAGEGTVVLQSWEGDLD